ncbi:hypothetical protein [Methylobacterium sp. Leaf466]|uniref:hypothetical protein n=1 Tax=Methylobacterium sp. Leaf466 TaxID=1736386 RepID=UPI0006FF0B5F|nr:hypothetical protein [Methylobacterium sp. Leaf466]KQT80740.1 hypothetical protein ASG59_04780 [Methylobacterium sp. Leaf466]
MRRPAVCLSACLALGLFSTLAFAQQAPAKATKVEKTFLIPAAEGYGVGDCLSSGSGGCGQVVADAWCESQGFASAGAFGIAAPEDYTGAIEAPVKPAEPPPIKISCQD